MIVEERTPLSRPFSTHLVRPTLLLPGRDAAPIEACETARRRAAKATGPTVVRGRGTLPRSVVFYMPVGIVPGVPAKPRRGWRGQVAHATTAGPLHHGYFKMQADDEMN